MSERLYWENGQMVTVTDPRYEEVEREEADSDTLVVLRKFLGILREAHHPQLTIDCLCLISGVCYDGMSMADIARDRMVSRAAVSRRVVDLCEAFGINPVRAMRSEEARANCKEAREKLIKKYLRANCKEARENCKEARANCKEAREKLIKKYL